MMKSHSNTIKRPRVREPSTALNNGHWHQLIEPKGAALLAQTFAPCHFVIKNHGPAHVRLYALRGDDMHLPPGKVRGTFFQEHLRVENLSQKDPVLIEFQFLPIAFQDS